jgi:predicted MPP superfamily phosphohydrolase
MEVHAHTHTERKKWTHYLWEFLMLFLAVFCGFLAENLREHSVEHQREKQYMQSLLADLQSDSIELSNKEKDLKTFPSALTQLANDCNKPILTDSIQREMYDLNMRYLGTMQIYFTDKTASQLKNAGGMRLIRNRKVADSIAIYWQGIEDLKFTYSNYENYRRPLRQLSFKIFNYINYKNADNTKAEFTNDHPQLTIKDPVLLQEYGSEVWLIASNIINYYFPAVEKQKKMIISLTALLKKEYHLK